MVVLDFSLYGCLKRKLYDMSVYLKTMPILSTPTPPLNGLVMARISLSIVHACRHPFEGGLWCDVYRPSLREEPF